MHGVLWGHCITSVRKDGNTLDDLDSKARFVMRIWRAQGLLTDSICNEKPGGI